MCNQLKNTAHCVWDTFQFAWDCPCRQSMTPKTSVQILYFWKRPWVNIYWFLRQYLTSGVIWGLYVCIRDTPDATRPFLVDISPSRAVFRAILVPRVPCDNSDMCVRARSLVTRLLTQTGFLTSDVTCGPWKWTNAMSETEIEPSCVGIGQKLISVDQKATTTMVTAFVTLWLRILRIFILPDTWLCCRPFVKNFGQTVCQSNCQSNTPIWTVCKDFWSNSVERSHFEIFLMWKCDGNNIRIFRGYDPGGIWSISDSGSFWRRPGTASRSKTPR